MGIENKTEEYTFEGPMGRKQKVFEVSFDKHPRYGSSFTIYTSNLLTTKEEVLSYVQEHGLTNIEVADPTKVPHGQATGYEMY